MKAFCNISPILLLIIVILGLSIISIFTNEVSQNSYTHFNPFFCSGWAGKCLIN